MNSRIATIARFTLLEAGRTRLPALVVFTLALLLAASWFIEQIAIADGARLQTSCYAASARFAMVFIVALHALAAVAREINDKGLDVMLALDLPRTHYLLGKLLGFIGLAAILAGAASLPLLASAPPLAVLQWGIALGLELAIVAALALFCIITLSHLIPAASFVMGFYLLARALTALRLIAEHPIGGATELSHQAMTWMVEVLALVLPAFDRWTQTDWLVNQPATGTTLGLLGAQSAVYVALLAAAAMLDFSRKNF